MKVLVVVDMQKIFARSDFGWHIYNINELWYKIDNVAKRFLDLGHKVVYTKFEPIFYDIDRYQGPWQKYYKKFPFAIDPDHTHLYDLIDVPDSRSIITAPTHTFGKIDSIKEYLGPDDDIYIAGVSTGCCILSTITSLIDQMHTVHLLEDCLAAGSEASHTNSMEVLKNFRPIISVISSTNILF